MIELNDIRNLCKLREVDLVITPPIASFTLTLRGEFDGYGDFFRIAARDVEYVDLARGVTVGDLVLAMDLAQVTQLSPKWSQLGRIYSGMALAIRAADAEDWGTGHHDFLIVASGFELHPGSDWRLP